MLFESKKKIDLRGTQISPNKPKKYSVGASPAGLLDGIHRDHNISNRIVLFVFLDRQKIK